MSFALFVSRNKKRPDELCPGSTLCSEFLGNIDEREVEVVDCNRPDFKRPAWLKGTPTLYEYETEKTWNGHQAVRRLYHMSLHYALAPSQPSAPSKPPPPQHGPPHARIAPPPHARGAPPLPPQPPPSDGDVVDDSIWASQIAPDMEDTQELETRADRKMTSDDLQRAMSQRMMTTAMNANGDKPQTMNAPPPPPPALND